MQRLLLLLCFLGGALHIRAQAVEEDRLGAWYMYFYNASFGDGPFGLQGDYQFRYWDFGSDLEQILIRNGLTYRPDNANALFTLGYASITTGTPGESSDRIHENRIYQEVLLPHRVGGRFLLTHRFRYEQRWVDDQDFRTRYRYNIFVNVPFNGTSLGHKVVYLALYNEIFINGQQQIGNGRMVERFDRNRTYFGLGYGISKKIRVQLGAMNQTTANWNKWQAQFSVHQNW